MEKESELYTPFLFKNPVVHHHHDKNSISTTVALHQHHNESSSSNWWDYPGNRPQNNASRSTTQFASPPPNTTLIRTSGNALQAIPNSLLEQTKNQPMMSVTIPPGVKAGCTMYVLTPDNTGRLIEVMVPENAFPGHTFLVRIPTNKHHPQRPTTTTTTVTGIPHNDEGSGGTAATPEMVVTGHDLEFHDLALRPKLQGTTTAAAAPPSSSIRGTNDNNNNFFSDEPNLMLVKVPEGARPGTIVQTRAPDGRFIEATVPEGNDNLKEFYVRIPPERAIV